MGAITAEVMAVLDERSARQVTDYLVRDVGAAGTRAGAAFSGTFNNELLERARTSYLVLTRNYETVFSRVGKTSAEAFGKALSAEATRTGLAADKIGAELTKRLEVHGQTAGDVFAKAFTSKLSSIAPMASSALSGIGSVASSMGAEVSAGGAMAAGGVLAIAAAAFETGKALYDIGQTFDKVSNTAAIRTGKMGSDLEALTGSIDNVAKRTASSIQQIGDIGGRLSQSLNISGKPFEDLTKQVADLDRMTGESLNIRDFGKVLRAFQVDGAQAGDVLDSLYQASARTGAPVNELVESLKNMGASARSLHLNLGQTSALIDAFDRAGLDAGSTTRGLNKAISEAVSKHLDLKTVLVDTITQMKEFVDQGDAGERKAQELGKGLFGVKGAQLFIDAVRSGKLTVDDINKSLSDGGPKIEDMSAKTLRWADTWTIVKNQIEAALKPLSEPVFDTLQESLRLFARGLGYFTGQPQPQPGYIGPPRPDAPPVSSLLLPGRTPQQPFGLLPGQPVPGGGPQNPLDVLRGVLAQGPTGGPTVAGPGQDVLGALDADGKPKGKPAVPYPAEYGQPPGPGETPEHWRERMNVIQLQHDVAEKRAEVDKLDKDSTSSQDDVVRARNELIQAQLRETEGEQRLSQQKLQAIQVPYGPGFGAAPRPGQTEQQYSAEQRFYEAQHKSAEAQAQLRQVQASGTATTEQRTEAENNLLKAQNEQYQSQLRLHDAYTKTNSKLDEVGVKLDADFGISKGLAGIADNITRFVANLAFAPALGALGAVSAVAGGKDATGSGLIGMIASSMGYGSAGGAISGLGGLAGALTGMGGGRFSGIGLSGAGGQLGAALSGFGVPAGANVFTGPHTEDTGGALVPRAAAVQNMLRQAFPGIDIGGYRKPDGYNEHSSGEALDIMVGKNQAMGDQINQFLLSNAAALGLQYDLWKQQTWNPGQAPVGMADRGSLTENHMDHVHARFQPGAIAGGSPGAPTMGGAPGANWPAIAQRESSGNWQANTGNGYFGGLQFTQSSWQAAGGTQYAPRADLASPQQQQSAAERLLAIQGPGAWPNTFVPSYDSGGGTPNVPGTVGNGGYYAVVHPNEWWMNPTGRTTLGDSFLASANRGIVNPNLLPHFDNGGGGDGISNYLSQLTAPPSPPPARTSEQLLLPGITPPGQSSPGTTDQLLLPGGPGAPMPPGLAPPGPPAAPGVQGPSRIGGAEAPPDSSGASAGGGSGGLPGAAVTAAASAIPGAGAAAQIGMQEMTRAIKAFGQYAGSATEGVMQTFLPLGGSQLAQNSWLTRLAGGFAQAAPALPNMAGKPASGPLSPEQAFGGPPTPFAPVSQTQAAQPGGVNVHIGELHVDKPETADKIVGDHTVASYAAGITGRR